MTSIPPLRPTETGSTDVEPAAVLRGSSPVRTAAAIAAAAAVFLAVVVLAGVGQLDTGVPAFLEDALGPEKAEAPLERTPATGVGVRINDQGYTVSHWGVSVSVASEDVGGADWRRHVHGVTRETDFGTETIVVTGGKTEAFLTVMEKQGERTWRWKLASRLHPRLDADGSVTFLDPTRHRVTSLVIDPVRILDGNGNDVTPEGLRWGLEESGAGWVLALELDDADLPLPYVIDPAVTHRAAQTSTTAGATSLQVSVPAGVQANDLLVAHIARVSNAAINTPSGWTAAGGTNNGNFIRQATYYRVAGASEPASYTWTWTGTQPAAGGMSAYYGVKASAPVDVIGTAATGNNTTTVTAPSLTTGANDALVLAFFSSNTNSTYSTAAGMSERYEAGTSGAASIAADDMTQAGAGATGSATATATVSGRVVGHQVSFNVDDVAPTGGLLDPGSTLSGTVVLTGSAADTDSAVASVLFQRSPANAGAWANIGVADTTSPYSVSFDTTSVADGLYDLRLVITDVAGNVTNSTIVEDRRVDNTAPASNTTFPASSGSYNAASWDTGCGTSGFCGTYSDGGSGVSQVEISIRQGSGDYWSAGSFSSASEAWNAAATAAGNWSYAFAAASFPAQDSYTIRVRAVDAAGNVESPNARTFTIDPDAPETAIDSSPANPTSTSGASFVFSSDEVGSTFECRLDGGSWGACTSPKSYASLADGSHTFEVRATDVAGNTDGSPASFTWLVDTAAPSSTATFPAASGEYNAAGWTAGCAPDGLCGTYSDGAGSGVAEVEVSIRQGTGNYWDGSGFGSAGEVWNDATLAAGDWAYAFSAAGFPADGSYTVRVRARDAVANTETPSTRTFEVDATAPTSTVAFPAASGVYNPAGWDGGCPTAGLCGTYVDGTSGVAEVEISIRHDGGDYWDGSGFVSATEVWHDADLAAGDWAYGFEAANLPVDSDYQVRVRAVDAAGNVESPAGRTFTFDASEPETSIDSTLPDPTNSSSASFDFSADEPGATFECALDGGAWGACTSPKAYVGLGDGGHIFEVRATDPAGNTDGSPAAFNWTIDTVAPTSAAAFPADSESYTAAEWSTGCPAAGLCGTYSDSGVGVVDVEVSIRRGTGSYWDGSAFASGTEVWNDATFSGGDWSLDFPAAGFPADGDYTVRLRARDDAGNTEPASTRTFTYDTTAPQTTIDASPTDPTASDDADFEFSADEPGPTFECRLDGGAWAACTSPHSYTGLTDGSHTFDVRATDEAGNTDGTPASHTWLIDTTAPNSTIAFPAAAGEYNTAAWNAGCPTSGLCGTHADGAGSGVDQVQVSLQRDTTGLYWDGASFSSASEVLLGTSLAAGDWSLAFAAGSFPADGDYTVRVFATDEVGNAETPATRTFSFDATAPTGSLTAPADGAALRGASVAVSSDSADTGSGMATAEFQRRPAGGGAWTTIYTDSTAPYSVAWDTTSLTDGDYDLRVVTTDEAGNTSASAIRTVTVDNTAPSAATLDALPGAIRNGQELTGSGTDATSGVGSLSYLYCEGASCTPATPIGSSTTGPDYGVTWTGQPADGDVRVSVRVTDRAGNTLDSAIQDVVVDNTNPTGALTAPADAALVGGTSVTVSSDSADAGSGVATAEFQRRPAGGGPWTEIDTDTSAPYSVAWDTTSLTDGDYDLRVVTTDEAGNTLASTARTVTVDNNAPSVAITAPTGFVNAAASDPFTVTASTPDGDVEEVELFSCSNASSGCSTGSWVSLGVDTTAPYSAPWAIDPDGNRALRAVATDGAGITGADVVNVTVDRTDPAGSLTAPADAAFVTGGSVAVSSDSADGGSGVATAEFQRRPAGGGAWTAIDTDTSAPYSVSWDTTSLTDGDYDLRAVTTDEAGNTLASAARTVTVDNSAPSAPALTLSESSPFAHVSGSEIFVNTDETGSYDVDATSADAHSGIDKVRFPGPVDDSSSPYSAAYAFGDLAGSQTVTAFNRAGLTASTQFTVTPDTAEPTGGSVSYPDGYDTDGDVTITVDAGMDALSGVAPASAVLERRTAPLAGGTCDPFAGAWSTVTSPDTVASGRCAQYRYRVSDRVGNEAVYDAAHVVKVDLASPVAPVLILDESSPFAHAVGTEIFVNTNETGSYDVQAGTSDAASGIEKVVFPGGVEDAAAPYTATYDFDDLLGVETVTAHDHAGNTASSDFEVTEDVSAPSTTDDTGTIGSAWQTAPVTVTLSPTDARSGVAATYYTTDGSVPTTSSDEGTSIDLTADGVYTIRYFSVDNVGNAEPVRTALATIRIDQTNPSTPAISLDESSPFAHVSGSEIFVNPTQTGSFDVSATSSDAGSGIDRIAFPGGVEDTTSPYSATYDLNDLSGLQTVTAHDAAGLTASDTFTVTPDTAAPAGGSVSYPDGYDADGTVTITVDAGTDALSGVNAASGVIERRTSALVGGVCDPFVGGWSPVTSPDTVADSTCARYRYRVSDRVGNEAIYTLPTSTVRVDLSPPQTTIDSAPADPSNDASPSFEFSSSEAGSTFECRFDGGAWAACTSPRSYASLADGGHTFQVRATDAAGHPDTTPASHTWTVDTAAPDTSFDDVPADPSNDDAPTFEFSASEPGAAFDCRLDGGAWGACSSPETIGLLADGGHTFQVRATDAAGNTDATPDSYTWTVDTVAPESSFAVVPADPTSDTTSTFEFSSTEPGSSFECRLDGGAWEACTSPATVGPLADGAHTFDVRATDAAGNQETTPESYAWILDAGSPTVSISQPAGLVNASDADPYTVQATSPDGDVTGVELFRCSDASADCSTGSWISLGTDATDPYEASWPLDADGNRALRAVVTDAAANTGEAVVNVTIDRTVPGTTIDSAPSDPSASTSASFSFSASEPGAGFECRLDGGAWEACSSPKGYAGLGEGNHTFDVRATDAAGNVDATPAVFAWTVDTIAPQTTIDAAPGDPSGSPAPSFEFSSSEPGSTFECRLDGGAWGACASPHGYAGLADGSHTFQVRATDAAGNVDGSPASHTWTIDATPPGGGLADPGQYLRGTVALTASPSDTGAGVQSVDFQVSPANADSWTSLGVDTTDPYSLNWDTTTLADGVYDLRIVVTDNASNSSPSAVVEDRIVDNTAPGVTMNDPGAYLRSTVSLTANASDAGSGVATVAFERSPAGAGTWAPVAASWDTTGVADGLYDLRVTVADNAGNSATSASVANRRVDNTKPSLTASTPTDGSTIASAGSLAVIAGEDLAGIAGATIDRFAAPAPSVSGNTVTYTQSFAAGPHTLAGELEDLAGNRQPIRVHFTIWSGAAADYPYVEKNSHPGLGTALRSTSDTTTVTVPAGAWTGAPAGDWLVFRIDPQPAAGGSGGFEPAGEILDVTAYWALAGSPVTSFSLPLEIEIDNTQAHVVPAVFESGSWRSIAPVSGSSLPASWNDGFEYDGTDVRILTRHLSRFTLLKDVQAPAKPGSFKGTVSKGKFSLSWAAASDNSGLISAYRIYANGALVQTVNGSQRSVAMGTFKATDKRSFQVAAVDAAGNVGPKSVALKVVPKVTKLTLAAAKSALTKRGFKLGKVTYKASSSIPKGKVIKGSATGLKPAGSRVALSVSKGGGSSARPVTPSTVTPPPPPPAAPPAPSTTPPPAPVPTTTAPTAAAEESPEPRRGRVLPIVGPTVTGLSDLRQELGLGLLAAAFSIAIVAALRARRPAADGAPRDPDQMLLWDQWIIQSIRRFLRLS